MESVYAVVRGRSPGLYNSWVDCEKQVSGFKDALFKRFVIANYGSLQEAKKAAAKYKYEVECIARLKNQASQVSTQSAATSSTESSFQSTSQKSWQSSAESRSQTSPQNNLKQAIYFAVISTVATGIFFRELHRDAHLKSCSYARHKSFRFIREAAEYIENSQRESRSNMEKQYPIETDRRPVDVRRLPKKFFRGCHFHVDVDGRVPVFVDGSCFGNGKKDAKAGLGVFFGKDHPMNISEPVDQDKQSNNVGELLAVKRALEVLSRFGIQKIKIYSDSHYVLRCFLYWCSTWEANGWNSSSAEKPIENKELIQEIVNLQRKNNLDVNWRHVKAHRGNAGNECADGLAKAGAARKSPRFKPY